MWGVVNDLEGPTGRQIVVGPPYKVVVYKSYDSRIGEGNENLTNGRDNGKYRAEEHTSVNDITSHSSSEYFFDSFAGTM